MKDVVEANNASGLKAGLFKRIRAKICKHCPACKHARKKPESRVGRILHHPLHSSNCPAWKAYNELYPG